MTFIEGADVEKTVLVVEDSQVIQRLIEVCLRPAGYRIEQCVDGASGLERARELLPDLVILDVGLPMMDGWEVLQALRGDEASQDLTIMMLTAHAQEDVREKADADGADAFLTKPFRPTELRDVVQRLAGPGAQTA